MKIETKNKKECFNYKDIPFILATIVSIIFLIIINIGFDNIVNKIELSNLLILVILILCISMLGTLMSIFIYISIFYKHSILSKK